MEPADLLEAAATLGDTPQCSEQPLQALVTSPAQPTLTNFVPQASQLQIQGNFVPQSSIKEFQQPLTSQSSEQLHPDVVEYSEQLSHPNLTAGVSTSTDISQYPTAIDTPINHEYSKSVLKRPSNNTSSNMSIKRRRKATQFVKWQDLKTKEEILQTTLIEVPSRMQIIDCKNPIFHPITGEELSRRINGVEKLRSCGTMCKYLMIGTGGGSAHHPSRADARYVMDKLKEDVSCTQTAIYSSFTLITEGDVKKIANDIEVLAEEVVPYNQVNMEILPLLGNTKAEQEAAINTTRKTMKALLQGLEFTKFNEATHGGMDIMKATWHVMNSILGSGTSYSLPVYSVTVLKKGYAYSEKGRFYACGSITLVHGTKVIIVDTGLPADRDLIIQGLKRHNLTPSRVEYVVCTHGHSDHISNNSLFPEATICVGNDISKQDHYLDNQLDKGVPFVIDEMVQIMPTPGHMCHDVSLIVKHGDKVTAITGDLFESEEDITNPEIWRQNSQNPDLQEQHRQTILNLADVIVPGHGDIFNVTTDMRASVKVQPQPAYEIS